MRALIPAEGRGTRIQSVHGGRTKSLIQFTGSQSTVLDHQIDHLFSAGRTGIGIVVGYEKDQIIPHVLTRYRERRRRFSFIENPAFVRTNNIYSLWLARTWLNREPFVCLDGDVVFAVQQLADEGLHVGFTSTGDLPWAEIDDPGDLAFARLYVFPRLASRPVAAQPT